MVSTLLELLTLWLNSRRECSRLLLWFYGYLLCCGHFLVHFRHFLVFLWCGNRRGQLWWYELELFDRQLYWSINLHLYSSASHNPKHLGTSRNLSNDATAIQFYPAHNHTSFPFLIQYHILTIVLPLLLTDLWVVASVHAGDVNVVAIVVVVVGGGATHSPI